jgi:diketogulonate reductase-like aldo/keto reductase
MDLTSTILLNNGIAIPRLGLGVFRSPVGQQTRATVTYALANGDRHIDTARIYRNEADVGAGIRQSGLARSDIFVTTKLWNDDQGYDKAQRALDQSLEALGLEYVDLYLMHWPVPGKRLDSWRAMEKGLSDGKVRAIGISNFMDRHIVELLDHAVIPPAVNQIELSPYNYRHRADTLAVCASQNIAVEAYSPLTKGQKLDDPRLKSLAEKYAKTPAQMLIRWVLEHDFIVLPKSNNEHRIRENADVFDFKIAVDDLREMDSWNEDLATGWDPTDAP